MTEKETAFTGVCSSLLLATCSLSVHAEMKGNL
jgi:hypothetical protein